jgi:formylglycine-generating enzyme required for sulfatase activity
MKSALIVFSFFCYSVASAQVIFDQHLVSNKNWSTFLQTIKNDASFTKQYSQSMVPDQWSIKQTNVKNQDSPVIGVSWQQATIYCEWRSVVATYLQTHSTLNSFQAMKLANRSASTLITYRLPSDKEWEKGASRFTDKLNSGIGFRCVHSVKKVA